MKGVKVALWGVGCVNLLTNAFEILSIHLSFTKKVENEKNFLDVLAELQKVINIWKMRNLSLLWERKSFSNVSFFNSYSPSFSD